MTRPSVAGPLDYATLAQLHRPQDAQALASEIRRLHADGLKPCDISAALRINLAQVLEIIGEHSAHDAPLHQQTRST